MPEQMDVPAVDVRSLTAQLALLELDPATLELLMAVLAIDLSDPVEIASAIRG
jgi:hypothetical protein